MLIRSGGVSRKGTVGRGRRLGKGSVARGKGGILESGRRPGWMNREQYSQHKGSDRLVKDDCLHL